jgi:hypothetical protein
MKKILLSCALIAGTFVANAQEKANAFKANIFSPIVKTGSFFYERKLNDKSSAQLGVGFTSYNKDNTKISGLFFTPEYRFYLSGESMNGFYVGPFLRYQNLKIEDKSYTPSDKATLSTVGGGVVVGRQWLFGNIVTLDIFAGPSYNSGSVKYDDGSGTATVPGSFNGFGARVGVTLGIAF